MSIRTSPWPAGVPCWVELATPDVAVVKPFYAAVLGWGYGETDDEYGGYTIAKVGEHDAAGLSPLQAEGQPTAWTVYFASDDVDATAALVRAAGGTVLMEPMDVGPMGRMIMAADPTGAVFGVWQAKDMIGAGIANEPGGLHWEDLRTADPATATAFYASVFGHRIDALPEAGPDYSTFTRPGEEAPLGGMGGMMGAPEGTPPHWLLYFGVADAAAAVKAADAEGGTVVAALHDSPYGTMAGITDPAGALFWVIAGGTDPR